MSFLSFFETIWHDLFSAQIDAAQTRATIIKDVSVALGLVDTAIQAVESQGLIGQNDRANIDVVMTDARKLAAALTSESSPSDISNAISTLKEVVTMLPDGSGKTACTVAIGTAAALLPALMQAVSPPAATPAAAG